MSNRMNIALINVFSGPSVWSSQPVVQIRIDAGPSSAAIPARLRAAMAQSGLNEPSTADRAHGFWRDARSIVEGIAFEMQNFAGDEVSFSASRPVDGTHAFDIALEYRHDALTVAVLELTVDMCNDLLSNTKSFDFQRAFASRVQNVVQGRTWHPQEESIFRAARQRGIPVRWVSPPSTLIELGTGAYMQRYRDMIVSGSSHLGDTISNNKVMTLRLLSEVGLPVPVSVTVRSEDEAVAAAESIGYPVVIKPAFGMQGRGLGVDLRTPEKVREFYGIAAGATRSGAVLVEQLVIGREHRILVMGDTIAAVAERTPAHVVGDGQHTIEELIAITNSEPLRGPGHTRILTNITVDDVTLDALARVGMDLDSIPAEGEHIKVKLASNLSQGGTSHDRTDDIHPENARLAILAARTIDIAVCGVDLITPDITRSIWEVGGAFIELNYTPGARMHLVPQSGSPRDLGMAIVNHLYPQGKATRVPVVAVAGDHLAPDIAERIAQHLPPSAGTVGLTTTSLNRIGNDLMSRADLAGRTHHQLVLRNPDVEMAVLQVESHDFDPPGLGFDYCDVVVLADPLRPGWAGLRTAEAVLLSVLDRDGAAILEASDPRFSELRDRLPERTILHATDPGNAALQSWAEAGGTCITLRGNTVILHSGGAEQVIADLGERDRTALPALLPALAAVFALQETHRS